MRRRRMVFLISVVAIAAAFPMSFIQAAAAQSTQRVEIVPVSFVLTPEQCPDLEATVTGEGEYVNVITETTSRVGGWTVVTIDSTATGTATDELGGAYTFFYHNVGTSTIIPGFGEIVRFTDHFDLAGSGSADGLSVDFNAVITPTSFRIYNATNNPGCDPI